MLNLHIHVLFVLHIISISALCTTTTAAGVEVSCATITECSVWFTWLSSTASSERCITQGFDATCRLRAGIDYFTTLDAVQCPQGWRHMQLTPTQSANGTASASHGLPSNLVLPGCYYLDDNEKMSSWDAAYGECMKMDGNSSLFYATNDLDIAWLADKLLGLQAGRHVPLNLHSFMYSAKGWAWAPPPPSVGGSGHKIIWTTAEKSIPWKDGEPNGAGNTGTSPEDCAEYGTVGNSGGGGLNDVSCSARHTASQLLCRLAPAKIDALRAVPQPATSSSISCQSSTPSWTLAGIALAFCLLFFIVIVCLFVRLRGAARKVTGSESGGESVSNAVSASGQNICWPGNGAGLTDLYDDTHIYDCDESIEDLGTAPPIPTATTANTVTAATSPARRTTPTPPTPPTLPKLRLADAAGDKEEAGDPKLERHTSPLPLLDGPADSGSGSAAISGNQGKRKVSKPSPNAVAILAPAPDLIPGLNLRKPSAPSPRMMRTASDANALRTPPKGHSDGGRKPGELAPMKNVGDLKEKKETAGSAPPKIAPKIAQRIAQISNGPTSEQSAAGVNRAKSNDVQLDSTYSEPNILNNL